MFLGQQEAQVEKRGRVVGLHLQGAAKTRLGLVVLPQVAVRHRRIDHRADHARFEASRRLKAIRGLLEVPLLHVEGA